MSVTIDGLLGISKVSEDADVVHVGDFGLGGDVSPNFITGSVDNLDENGFYCVSGAYAALANTPENLPGMILVHKYVSAAYATQIFTQATSGRMWIRNKNNNSWGSWRELYSETNILGTVSQSAGVPTGAIIESGSNANGRYTKWADGTMICTHKLAVPAWSANGSSSAIWTHPAVFSAIPTALLSGLQSAYPHTYNSAIAEGDVASSSVFAGGATAASGNVYVQAIGRWF